LFVVVQQGRRLEQGGGLCFCECFQGSDMPRYYFNVRDGRDVDEDEEGVELPDLEAARAEALATVAELRDELGPDAARIELEITDDAGRRLLTIPFGRSAGKR
jgi:hypothetical protein